MSATIDPGAAYAPSAVTASLSATANGDAFTAQAGRPVANCNEEVDDPATGGIQYRLAFTRSTGTLDYRLGH